MPEYRDAGEVAMIARELINQNHTHLKEASIAYLFRDPPAKSKGEEIMGKASKVTGKYKELTGKDFVIEISEKHFFNLDDESQAALVDHELSHCWIDDEGKPTLLPHDFEG
ncbi:MAG: putative metallopeptidase, partial [Halanaerobiales bacterium]